ncbi:MAG: alpha/beta hydrolase fold domain-containing protein [Deltaproteobacteria bacterium]|nr:alpha/beta hydrolase fold domain-containing protein [Deltaproteobacteria bacterium]
MASKPYAALLKGLAVHPLVGPDDTLEEAREKLEAVHGHAIGEGTRVEWVELGGVRCAWVDTPETREAPRTLVLCHGGAYVAACGDGYLFYAEMLARPCAARLLLVDYRLAPAHRHPAALEDCASAYRGLLDEGHAPGRIGFVGDSCGGTLAITSLLHLRDQGVPMPALAATLGGWFDLEAGGESATHPVGPDPFAHPEFTRARGRDYVGPGGDLRDPLVSPIHADPTGLPPLFLQAGQVDLTRDDAVRLAKSAGRAGVDVTLEIVPEMIHGFQGLASAGIPEAVAALDRLGAFVRSRIPDPEPS